VNDRDAQRCGVRLRAIAALLLGIVAGFAPATHADDTKSARATAALLGVALPDFPADLAPGDALEVGVRFRVDAKGRTYDVAVTSPPSRMDAEVERLVRTWFVVPAVCGDSGWSTSEVRTALAFSWNAGSKIITIRDPQWYATGPQIDLPNVAESTKRSRIVRISGDDPQFPRRLLLQRIRRGVVAALLDVDDDGRIASVSRTFSWPSTLFEEATRDALKDWRMGYADGSPVTKGFLACVEVNFSVR